MYGRGGGGLLLALGVGSGLHPLLDVGQVSHHLDQTGQVGAFFFSQVDVKVVLVLVTKAVESMRHKQISPGQLKRIQI